MQSCSPVVDIRDVGNESHECLQTPGQRLPMVIHKGRWGRAVSNAVVQILENVDFRHWYWEWQNRQKLRRWENLLSSFYQASLFSNYLVGCRLNFTLKSKCNLKTEYCQKQSGIFETFIFTPGEVLEKTEERLVYGIEYNSTLLECTPRTLQAKVIWLVQRAHETKKEEVIIVMS